MKSHYKEIYSLATPLERTKARRSWRLWPRVVALCLMLPFTSPVLASETAGILPMEFVAKDRNLVNLAALSFSQSIPDVTIGYSGRRFSHSVMAREARNSQGLEFFSALDVGTSSATFNDTQVCYYFSGAVPSYIIELGGSKDIFCSVGSVQYSLRNPASSLVVSPNGSFTYTTKSGATYNFAPNSALVQTVEPSGLTSTYNYSSLGHLTSITRNDGLQLHYSGYGSFILSSSPLLPSQNLWSGVTAINTAVEYCDPSAETCTLVYAWPSSVYSSSIAANGVGTFSFQDAKGTVTRITTGVPLSEFPTSVFVTGFKPGTSASGDTIAYGYCWDFIYESPLIVPVGTKMPWLCQATSDGGTWYYDRKTFTNSPPYGSVTAVGRKTPTGVIASMVSKNIALGSSPLAPLQWESDEQSRSFVYDTSTPYGLLHQVRMPEGDTITYDYDARGNVIKATHQPKAGSTQTPLYEYADYDVTCVYPAKCNKPNWTKDANGNQTDYTYDNTHGGVLSKTLPAVPVDGAMVRPQTRYSYVQRYAWYKNAAGAMARAATPIWVLDKESYCIKGAAHVSGTGCALGSADEVVTQYDYGPDAGPNNLFLMGVAVTADGVTRRTCYSYDRLGNKISETTPNALLASCPGPSY